MTAPNYNLISSLASPSPPQAHKYPEPLKRLASQSSSPKQDRATQPAAQWPLRSLEETSVMSYILQCMITPCH